MEEAVYADCRMLINEFVKKAQPSFQSFCTVWKNLCFQHIFTMQTTYIQVQQTTACAFHIGKRLLCNRNVTRDNAYDAYDISEKELKLLERIGGLYLLYAIYFKQPLDQYTKIEVSLETWREIKHFIQNVLPKEQRLYDEARYIFWKLYEKQAFRFTALDYCLGLEGLVNYDHLDSTKSNSLTTPTGFDKMFDKEANLNDLLQRTPALVTLEKGYNEMKSELTKLHQLDKQLLPPTNIFQTIQESFEKINKVFESTNAANEFASSSSNVNSKRRSIKDKAFGFSEAKKSNPSNSETENEKNEPQRKKIIKRLSARTIFKDKLPEEFHNDTDSDDEADEATYTSEEDGVGVKKSPKKSEKCVKASKVKKAKK